MTPRLRSARATDLDELTAVFLACWTESYAAVMPAELVASMTPASARDLWRGTLAGDTDLVVAEGEDGALLGQVGFRMTEPTVGYVASLYVSPTAQGTGTGRLLLAAAEDRLRAEGAARATLWVFEQNLPSRGFYERRGWRLDGRRETLPEWGQPQVGMVKELA